MLYSVAAAVALGHTSFVFKLKAQHSLASGVDLLAGLPRTSCGEEVRTEEQLFRKGLLCRAGQESGAAPIRKSLDD